MSELAEGFEKSQSPPAKLWEQIRQDPLRAPEHIALAASEYHGPAAAAWADKRRRTYGTDARKLAQMARRRHTTMASVEGAATGVGGFITMVPDMIGLAWIESRLVFFIAAAYGYDPLDPMRPAELLVLNGVYDDPTEARQALDRIGPTVAEKWIGSKLERQEARGPDDPGLRDRVQLGHEPARHERAGQEGDPLLRRLRRGPPRR
jgi:hypothetical protein